MTEQPEIFTTGVAGLDTILGGGLSRNALVFFVGPPGAGKTILATQILFAAVRAGSPGLILTAFSEDHSKLIGHLRPLSFFDDGLISTQIQLLTLGSMIGADGRLDTTMVIQTVRRTEARVILIDGFQGVPELFVEPIVVRRMLDSLSKLAQMLRITMLVTMEGDGRDPSHAAYLTMADVVIDLDYQVAGWRHTRRLDVVKQRGRPALPGLHSYTITDDGFVVSPRLETLLPRAPRPRPAAVAPFGVPALDGLLGGGLPAGTAALLTATPGTGKTTLALRWALAGASPEHSSIVVAFHADAPELEVKAAAAGLDLAAATASGACAVLHVPPVAIDPDAVADQIRAALRPGTRRVVIDDLGGLIWELGDRARDYLAALALYLAHAGAATLFLLEAGPAQIFHVDTTYTLIAPIAETVLLLEEQAAGEGRERVVRILTTRYGPYDAGARAITLPPVRPVPPPLEDRAAGA